MDGNTNRLGRRLVGEREHRKRNHVNMAYMSPNLIKS